MTQRCRISILTLALALLMLAAPTGARAEELDPALEAPVPSIMSAGEEGDLERFEAWLEARHTNARAGKREIVRIPVTWRSLGWGCPCPAAYLGVDPDGHAGGPWLALVYGDVDAPEFDEERGTVMILEGVFTGERHEEDLRGGPDGPDDFVYTLDEFEVLGVHRPSDEDEDAPRVEVLLQGELAAAEIAPLRDERPWLVIAASVPLAGRAPEKKAEAERAKLVEAGFDDAEILDSRATTKLACCFLTVAAGRFATQDEARARLEALREAKLDGYLKQGW